MKLLIFISALLFFGCSQFVSSDNLNHFAFSASFVSVGIVESDGRNVAETACIVVGLGLMKEIYDSIWGTGFQTSDLVSDIIGVSLAAFATVKIINREELP